VIQGKPKSTHLGNRGAWPGRAHHRLTVVDTTSYGDYCGQTMVAAPFSPRVIISFTTFRFSLRFLVGLCYYLPLKKMNLAAKRGRLHSFRISPTHSNTIGEIGRKRKRVKQKQWCGGKIKRSSLRPLSKHF